MSAQRDRVRNDAELVTRIRRKHLVKNVMGYGLRSFLDAEEPIDILARLLVGSEGTLAFISSAISRALIMPSSWLTRIISAPKARMVASRSWLILSGIINVIWKPRIAATMANAMPVLPLVASTSASPGLISPRCSA